jgi:hypothetical protein
MSKLAAELVLALAAGADAPTTATTATNTDATMRLITMNSPSMREGPYLPPDAQTILSRHPRYVNVVAGQSTLLTLWPGGDDSSHASRPVSALGLMAI